MSDSSRDGPRFEEFVIARWGPLVRAAVLLGCDMHSAEDIAQSTLLRCYKSWQRVVQAQDVDAYVYKIALNIMRDSRRRMWTTELPTPELDPPVLRAASDVHDEVKDVLLRLPFELRQVLVLRYYVDLTERQAAEVAEIAVGTVKSRTARALKAFERELRDVRSQN